MAPGGDLGLCDCVDVGVTVCVCVCFLLKEFANVPEHHDSVGAWVSPTPTHLLPVYLFSPHSSPPSFSFELTLHPIPPRMSCGISPENSLSTKILSPLGQNKHVWMSSLKMYVCLLSQEAQKEFRKSGMQPRDV